MRNEMRSGEASVRGATSLIRGALNYIQTDVRTVLPAFLEWDCSWICVVVLSSPACIVKVT